ncbi:MAG TPA: DUF3810 domain-containing protein [Chitinophagaceae bacterium]|nr:DUF3810 domain-containing protein [Chitinophagaceae bacterium]
MQKLLSRLFARLMKSWSWVLLIALVIAIKWISLYPDWVEKNYTYGIYPVVSKTQRLLFGWIPFSIGDIFYAFLVLVILVKTFQFLKLLFKKKLTRKYFISGLQQFIFFFLFLYVVFNLLWGLNYNRKGISHQLGLEVKSYNLSELDTLTTVLEERLNQYAGLVNEKAMDSFRDKKFLFDQSVEAYDSVAKRLSFLNYSKRSVKPSLFSYAGNYLGFQGYYDPFSGEAQVNTTIPPFLEPYVTTHEIAHQLGYAKENEANFVAFLACRSSASNEFRYSLYFNMYAYAINEVFRRDSLQAKEFQKKLHPQVIKDFKEYREFYKKYKNPVEPVIMWFYSHYLKANNQPAGKQTYDEVVAWLIVYYKKFGTQVL